MEDSHYDEFGNYIGPALSDSDQVGALLQEQLVGTKSDGHVRSASSIGTIGSAYHGGLLVPALRLESV